MHIHCIHSRRTSKKGSLILEALLSIVILSTSIMVIIQAMTSSLRAMAYSAQYSKIANALENEMVGLIFTNLTGNTLADIKGEEKTEKPYETTVQSEILNDSDQEHIKDVRLNVSWISQRKNKTVSINTYLLGELNAPE